MKQHAKWIILGLSLIVAVAIHGCANRYSFSHYQGTTTVYDHWTGEVTKQ